VAYQMVSTPITLKVTENKAHITQDMFTQESYSTIAYRCWRSQGHRHKQSRTLWKW